MKKITEFELGLLKDCLEMFENTHSYYSDIYSDVKLAINIEMWSDPKYLLRECKFYLSDTHCYDTELYTQLENYLNNERD